MTFYIKTMKKLNKENAWEDKIETHPWVKFPQISTSANYFILGSFPPNKFTNHKSNLNPSDFDFFYGSNRNKFWSLFAEANNIDFKNDPENLKNWLHNNKWVISDIVLQTYRKKDSAYDSDLLIEKWNCEVISEIFSSNPIKKISFTSKWVKEKFERNVKPFLNNQLDLNIQTIILISPSPNGLMSLDWARKILPQFQDENKTQYRLRYYKETLIK